MANRFDNEEMEYEGFELNPDGGIKSCGDCADCSDCDECSDKEPDYIDNVNAQTHIDKVIMICGAKGGVGKSTVTAALAEQLVSQNFSVGILDADLSGSSISLIYGVTERPMIDEDGIHPVITKSGVMLISLPLFTGDPSVPMLFDAEEAKGFAVQFYSDVVWGRLDYLLIDTPSATDDILQEMILIRALDGMLVVTDKSRIASIMASRSIKFSWVNRLNVLGIIENFADRDGIDHATELSAEYELPVLDRLIFSPRLAELADSGRMSELKSALLPETAKLLCAMKEEREE